MKKRFSMRNKLLIIFGLLIAAAAITEGLLAVQTARKAVTEKIETHLKDKATDIAEVIDGRLHSFFQFIEGIARMPFLYDGQTSAFEKSRLLNKEAHFNKAIQLLAYIDLQGNCSLEDGRIINLSERKYLKRTLKGEKYISEPYISKMDKSLVLTLSVPVYDSERNISGVLMTDISGFWLADQIKDIVVGKTGECYVIDQLGYTIADKDRTLVESRSNASEEAKTNGIQTSLAAFEKKAMETGELSVGCYEYSGIKKIASSAKIKSTGWTVIIAAPIEEFMGNVDNLRNRLISIGLIILVSALIITFFVARGMVKPVNIVVAALKDIAQGEGDLTVRLPVSGNDEITDLSEYFNQTIGKIGSSIQNVDKNTTVMEDIGNELSTNMTETASAVHQISANIDGVQQQALTQSASVSETAATVEEIIRTIKQVNSSIENQAASVAQSSSAVEQMVANIASITQTLDKTNDVIKTLAAATADGKETIAASTSVTQKIAEESGSLLEASNVIQHIAS